MVGVRVGVGVSVRFCGVLGLVARVCARVSIGVSVRISAGFGLWSMSVPGSMLVLMFVNGVLCLSHC